MTGPALSADGPDPLARIETFAEQKCPRDAGWIEGERRGTWVWYSLRPQAVARFRELAGGFGPNIASPATSRRLPVVEARA